MSEVKTNHEKLQYLVELAPIIKELHATDVAITISDTEKVIHQLSSNEFDAGYHVGRKLESNEPMAVSMRYNRREVLLVPEEAYGVALRVIVTPVTDANNRVIGSIAISTNRDNQSHLLRVAEQFASTSEEISASTEELTSSATNFTTYMEKLAEAQQEMTKQVEDTAKILELINNVAKNTRILGFNAGIEAARSGEHGKGFSVVAKEITKLAEQSAGSVNEIRNLLEQLKSKVEQVATYVDNTLEISEHQTSAISEIATSIQSIANVAEEIEEMAQKIL